MQFPCLTTLITAINESYLQAWEKDLIFKILAFGIPNEVDADNNKKVNLTDEKIREAFADSGVDFPEGPAVY